MFRYRDAECGPKVSALIKDLMHFPEFITRLRFRSDTADGDELSIEPSCTYNVD